jgi:hypothetical protein
LEELNFIIDTKKKFSEESKKSEKKLELANEATERWMK